MPESDARVRSLRGWIESRRGAWRAAHARVERVAAGTATPDDVFALPSDYRLVARDLAAARVRLAGTRGTAALEALYARLHGLLDRGWQDPRDALARAFAVELPAAYARVRAYVAWVAALFVGTALAGAWLVSTWPELGGLFLSEDAIEGVEAGRLWTEGLLNVVPSSLLSAQILANNVAVTLTAFGLGLLFGLGTFYIVALNGLMLGAVFAFTAHHGLGPELSRFVAAHAPVELSVICLAGGAGAWVGDALVRPGGRTRGAALQQSTREVLPLLLACCGLLVVCGFVEGYVSPDPAYGWGTRLAIGLGLWIAMAAALLGPRRRRA